MSVCIDCGRRCESCDERMCCYGPEPFGCGTTCDICRDCLCGECKAANRDRDDDDRAEMVLAEKEHR